MSTQNQQETGVTLLLRRGEESGEGGRLSCRCVLRCADLPVSGTGAGPTWRPGGPAAPGSSALMLRAGLIGFASSGKTALFQLLTSAREAPRSGKSGKSEANVGVSRVPDERLDKLTALFNPRKHVPATVEFADIAGAGGARAGAQALLDVAPFRNADA